MSKTPLVTVGVPFRNPGPLIVDAVKSVFAQTVQDWELILVNDGSTDNSTDLVCNIRDKRVILIDDGMSLGLPKRLNQIASLARGKYIARMDADDVMHPERLEKQINFLEEYPEVDVVDTGAIVLGRERRPVGVKGLSLNSPPSAFTALKWGVVLHPSVMGRREWFKKNLYDPRFPRAEDREFFIRRFQEDHFVHIPEPLYFYFYAGNVRVKDFLLSYRSERAVLLRYGPALVGWGATLFLYLYSILKSLALVGLVAMGKQDLIARRAYSPISPELGELAKQILSRVREQPVPGW